MEKTLGTNRYIELDSLRGLAALAVFFSHIVLILNSGTFIDLFQNTPLHIFWDGAAAVVLFFVLSGFVLTLPYIKQPDKPIEYLPFLTRRIFRIYPAYIAGLAFALVLKIFLFNKAGISGFSSFINQFWDWKTSELTLGTIVKHIVMIGPNFTRGQIDPIIWSLIVEMKISIILPIFIFFIRRIRRLWIGVVTFAVALVFCYASGKFFLKFYPTLTDDVLAYLPMFILGGLLANFHAILIENIKKLSRILRIIILCVGLILYSSRFSLYFLNINYSSYNYIVSIGVAIIIIISISHVKAAMLLTLKPIKLLGKISYSFYLFHFPILMTFTSLVYSKFHSVVLAFAISLFISILVSYTSYKLVEMPFQLVGRSLSKKVSTSGLFRYADKGHQLNQ
ncbi:MAG: acyltransferase [Bacillota bacterium]|nr:acyltransferase [Bacillota bacterium]